MFSPLIALMRDQVRSLCEKGIPSAYINSEQSEKDNQEVLRKAINNEIKILYIAPERQENYEWKEADDGTLYLTPTKTAQPEIYDPLKSYQGIVIDALNIGRMAMSKQPDDEIQKAIREFAIKYGLLGLMTALPTTPNFMEYEAVYLPKNHLIREETMKTEKYLNLFFPFDKLDVIKHGVESMWSVENDRAMMALMMTMSGKPMAVNMGFQREYAERYDWMKQQFTDWIFTFSTSILYYEDYDTIDEDGRNLYRQSMAAFEGSRRRTISPYWKSPRLSGISIRCWLVFR